MEYKLIIDENKYVHGATVKLTVGETLLFTKALGLLYFYPTTPKSDKKCLNQMLIEIEKGKFNV